MHIYRGALAALALRPRSASREAAAAFCASHMANEASHLRLFEAVVPEGKRTRLLPLWRVAGWTLGFAPTLAGGGRALYVTVEAVETFVEEHFLEQIVPLKATSSATSGSSELVRMLEHCCADEVHHKEDAAKHLLDGEEGFDAWWVRPWSALVRQGSAVAAEIARRL